MRCGRYSATHHSIEFKSALRNLLELKKETRSLSVIKF